MTGPAFDCIGIGSPIVDLVARRGRCLPRHRPRRAKGGMELVGADLMAALRARVAGENGAGRRRFGG